MSAGLAFVVGVALGIVAVALLGFALLWIAERCSWDDTNGPERHNPDRYHR